MKNETKNYRASAFGFQNKMYAANGFAAGVGNEATKAARSGINIRGSYAIVQNNDTFIDVVGGGSDADHRANASALTPAGNLRIKGDIFVKCNSDSSGGTNLRTALDAKEDKGTFVKVDEVTISEDIYGDFRYDMPAEYKCVMIWLSLPRPVAETFRVFTASANNQNGIEITTTAGSSGNVCNVKIKFDCTHGILEAEGSYTSTQNYGGYVTKRCYASYENEPVLMTSVGTIIIRNTAASPNNIIRTGTKMKIYGY